MTACKSTQCIHANIHIIKTNERLNTLRKKESNNGRKEGWQKGIGEKVRQKGTQHETNKDRDFDRFR